MEKNKKLVRCVEQLLSIFDTYPGKRLELAQELGIDRKKLWSWTSAKENTEPGFSDLLAIGKRFRINMNWFFFGEGPMFREKQENLPAVRGKVIPITIAPRRTALDTADRTAPVEIEISEDEYIALVAQHNLHDAVYALLSRTGASPEALRAATNAIISGDFGQVSAEAWRAMQDTVESVAETLERNGADQATVIRAVLALVARPF